MILPFAANVRLANEVLTLVIFGCAAVVTVPAVVAAPDNAPTNVVAVIDALPKLALMLVLITADELPFADEVVNIGYTVVEVDVFCNSADALVALVALVAVPDNAPTNVVAAIDALPKLALMLLLITADELPLLDEVVNVGYTVVEVDVFCNSAAALVALVALLTVPVTLAPTIELNPLPLPVNTPVFAVMFAAVIVPLTPNDVSVPTLVIFGCALVVTVPAVFALP